MVEDFVHLADIIIALSDRLLSGPDSESTMQIRTNVQLFCPEEFHPQKKISGEFEPVVLEPVDSFPKFPSPECTFLLQRTEVHQLVVPVEALPVQILKLRNKLRKTDSENSPGLVRKTVKALHPFAVRRRCECRSDTCQTSRQQHVIGIDPTQDVSRTVIKTFLDCIVHSSIRLRTPVVQLVCVPANDVDTVIRRSSINDDVFQIRIALAKDRTNRLFQILTRVVTRSDNADSGQIGG